MFAQHPGNQGKEGGVDRERERQGERKKEEEEKERKSHCSKVSLGFLLV